MSLQELIGYSTAIGETTRESGNILGNSLKTIASRVTTMNPSIDALASVGVAVHDLEGNVRPVARILDDLGERWQTLNAEQQQSIGLQIAGRFQLSRFLVLMGNYDRALEATATATNSAGSAAREQEIFYESLEARLARLSNTFTEIAIASGEALLQDGIIVFAESIGTLASSGADLIQTFGLLPSVIGAASLATMLFNNNLRTSVMTMGMKSSAATTLTGTLGLLQKGAIATGTAFATMGRFMAGAFPPLLLISGVTFALEKLFSVMMDNSRKQKEIEDNLNDSVESLQANESKINSMVDSYAELEKAKESAGKLNTDEEAEYNRLTSELATLLPSVVTGMDAKGQAIILNSDKLRTEIELLERKLELEKADAIAEAPQMLDKIAKTRSDLESDRESNELVTSTLEKQLEMQQSKIDEAQTDGQRLLAQQKYDEMYESLRKRRHETNTIDQQILETAKDIDQVYRDIISSSEYLSDGDLEWLRSLGKGTEDTLELGDALSVVRQNVGEAFKTDNVENFTSKQANALADISKSVKQGETDWDSYKKTLNDLGFEQTDNVIRSLQGSVSDLQAQLGQNLFEDLEGSIPITSMERLNELNDEGATLYMEINGQIVEYTENMDMATVATDTFADTVETLYDAYDQTSSEMSILNGLLDDLAEGKSLTATEVMKMARETEGLIDQIQIENGQIKLNEQGIEQLRQAKMKAYSDMIEAERKSLLATGDAVKEKLKSYGIEIQAIKSVADAKQELARLDEEIYNANASIGYGGEESSADIYRTNMIGQARREVSDFSEQLSTLDKLSELAGSSLSTVGSEIENTANASSDAADSQKDSNDQTKEALYITDEYRNKMARFNAEQAKLNRLKSQYAQHSKKYRDAIQKEIDLLERQRSTQQAQVDDLNNQIKTGNYKQTGMQSWTTGSTGYNQNGQLVTRVSEPAVRASGGNQQHTVPASTSSSRGAYSGKYAKEINAAASKHGVDPHLIAAIIQQESAFKPNARSHAGAQGLMQLMPATARSLGVKDSYNVSQNIDGGTKYIAQQLKAFGTLEKALAAYNAGPGNVRKYGGIPPFKETQNYVKKITGNYSGNGYSSSGGASVASSGGSSGGQMPRGWDKKITSNYGMRTLNGKTAMHHGMDLRGATGDPLDSIVSGKVIFAGMGTPGSGYNGYGNTVAVQASDGNVHLYGHLDKVIAKKGQTVNVGDQVGTIGNTGNSFGSHLHYEIRKNGELYNTINPQGMVGQVKAGNITSAGGSGSGEGVSVGIANKAQSKDNAQNEIIGIEGEIGSIDEQISKLRAEIINSQLAEYDREREKIEERLAEIDLEQSETYDSSPTWIKLQQEREKLIAKQLQQDENAKKYLEGEIKNNKNLTEAQISDLQDLLRQRNISISQVTQELNDVAFSVIEANLRAFTRKKEELQNEFDKLDYQMNREAEGTKKWIDLQLKREKLLQDEIKHDIDAIKYVKDQIKNNKNLNASQKEVLKNNLTDLQSEYWSKEQEILDARLKMVDQVTDAYKKALEAQRDAGVKVIDDLISAIDKEASDEDYNKRLQKEYDKRQEIMDDIAKLSLDDSMGTQKQVEDLKKQLEEQNMSIEDMQTDRTRELRKDALNEQKDELTNKYDQILNDEEKFNKIREQMITGSNKAIIKDLNEFYKAVSGNKNIDKTTQNDLKNAINSANSYLSGSKDISKIQQFNTGGYTGNNVPKSGALAILDNKELVLDKNDTKNFLEAVKEMRFLQNNGFIEKLKSSYIPGMNLSHLTSGLNLPKNINSSKNSTTTHSTVIQNLIGNLNITGDKAGADHAVNLIKNSLDKKGIRYT
ncbi:phage tail tape measure protein [Alkalihalobacillus sp. NPDC078783]